MPVESPNHGGQSTVVNPADLTASPYGWHDTNGAAGAEYTITRGNNVHAQDDQNDNNGTGFSPDGGGALDFLFPVNTANAPSTYLDGALTNLFYWNNIIHDVFYQYGFDEASGNFQQNNYGKGGSGGDYVLADGQDGGGVNNANFATPSDGSNPRMQMYLWTTGTPDRDGDLDNGIIAHEYGHGISNRLTGGRFANTCLTNAEQAGEGWSDYFGLVLTHKAGDTRNTPRGIGTYSIDEGTGGTGIRQYPYTTDMTVNLHTYDDIRTVAVPHGVGSVMCATLWDLYWDLIDVYGYDSDIYFGTGGNNIAIQLVIDGLKMQPCSPGFMDVRDAILAADELNYGGVNKCTIWSSFARRGMGYYASQGSSSSRSDGTEDFSLPPDQGLNSTPDKTIASNGEVVNFVVNNTASCIDLTDVIVTDTVPAGMTYVTNSASDGGVESGGVITWPTIPSLTAGSGFSFTFQATMNTPYSEPSVVFYDDLEAGGANWMLSNASNLNNWALTTSPNSFAPGTTAWFAVEPEADPNVSENEYLTLSWALLPDSELQFNHKYDTEANWDGGQVEISEDDGLSWTDLGPNFTANGYNDYIRNNNVDEAFAGNSGGYLTSVVDLSSFCGNVLIRFNFYYDQFVAGNGWYVDDVQITSAAGVINTAHMSSNEGVEQINTDCITVSSLVLPVEWVNVSAQGHDVSKKIEVSWSTAAEINNKGYFIERLNNNKFIEIGWVDTQATASTLRSYMFEDRDVNFNQVYTYRIRQVDFDGQSSYSNIVTARLNGATDVKIYPNPLKSGSDLFFTGLSANDDAIHIELIDQQGRTIRAMELAGETDVRISTASFSPGVYILRWASGVATGAQRIIIY
ncbi:UNVERIFIED_CONTAM: hypothetical protein GTU68_067343 [Idotea baltica]|nr:hypothetical protein [Idotea baltica]